MVLEKVSNITLLRNTDYLVLRNETSIIAFFRKSGIYKKLESLGSVYDEKSISGPSFNKKLTQMQERCKHQRCVLFAVCRGKISEGIDFADSAARVVMAIGTVYEFLRTNFAHVCRLTQSVGCVKK